jgi:hypothetical protein
MIIYDPKTETKRTMYLDEYMAWLREHADVIRILPIRRGGYTPLIEMYKGKQKVGYHTVGVSQDEAAALNAMLPKQRKNGYFTLNRAKRS